MSILMAVNMLTRDFFILFITAIIVGIGSFVLTAIAKKTTGREAFRTTKDATRKLIYMLLFSLAYATSFAFFLATIITGDAAFLTYAYPSLVIDIRYIIVYAIVWFTNIILSLLLVGG